MLGSPAQARQAARSATSRSGTGSTRRRGSAVSTSFGSASTAPAGGCRCRAAGRRARRVEEAIELVDASAYARRPIGECSGGEQQRLLIAAGARRRGRGCCSSTSRSTASTCRTRPPSRRCSNRICRSEQMTILLVAHDVNPLLTHLDRVVYVAGGRILSGRTAAGDHERDAERALRIDRRGAAHARTGGSSSSGSPMPRHTTPTGTGTRESASLRSIRSPISTSSSSTRSWSMRSRRARSSR